MAEYIERDALLKTSPFTKYGGQPNEYNDGYLDCAEDAREAVKAIPTADVVEARHGVWMWDVETHGDPMYGVDEDFGYRCSECKVWADEWGVDGDIYEEPPTRLHYCPNCGAKMDGKGEGE